jgi:hypothetical protein
MRQTLSIAGTLFLLLAATPEVHAQGLLTREAGFFAWMPGSRETMRGRISMSLLSRQGAIYGRTNTGIKCSGRAHINVALNRGSGMMRCADGRSGKFTYYLSSRLPLRGKGEGRLKTGQRVLLRIMP